MDPYSLARGAFTAFKDVYLVSKFVYKTVKGYQKKDADWSEMESKFRHEVAVVGAFGRAFLQNNGSMDKDIANEPSKIWLRDVGDILERQQGLFANYAKIAFQQDPDYQRYGLLNSAESEQLQIGFAWDLDENESVSDEPIEQPASQQVGAKKRFKDQVDVFKFVWFHKEKLQRLLGKTREETARLLDWVPMIIATHPRYRGVQLDQDQIISSITDRIASQLRIGYHSQIKQITMGEGPVSRITTATETRTVQDLILQNDVELAPIEAPKISSGTLQKPGSTGLDHILIEYKPYRLLPVRDANQPFAGQRLTIEGEGEIDQLACLLASAGNPNYHTLSLRGYVNQSERERYAFVFDYPPNTHQGPPTSLYSIIDGSVPHENPAALSIPLQSRFNIAQILSKTLAAFHADGWVHKSIQSQSVVFFKGMSPQLMYNNPYLVGFEYARPDSGDTGLVIDMGVERNIYRHLDRQGAPLENFSKLHDIYSLGVVLLEIGLMKTAMDIYKEFYNAKPTNARMPEARDAFKAVAKQQLATSMGTAYSEAVGTCLSSELVAMEKMTNFGLIFMDRVVRKLGIKELEAGIQTT